MQRKTFIIQITIFLLSFFVQCYVDKDYLLDSRGRPTLDIVDNIYFHFISMSTIGFGDYTVDFHGVMHSSSNLAYLYLTETLSNFNFLIGIVLLGAIINFLVQISQNPKKKKHKENKELVEGQQHQQDSSQIAKEAETTDKAPQIGLD